MHTHTLIESLGAWGGESFSCVTTTSKTSRRLTSHDDLPGPAHDWLGATVASPAPRPSLPHGKTDPGKQAHTALLVSPPQPQRSTLSYENGLASAQVCPPGQTAAPVLPTRHSVCAGQRPHHGADTALHPLNVPRYRKHSRKAAFAISTTHLPSLLLLTQNICGSPHNNGLTHRHQSLRVAACRRSHGSGPTRSHRR